MQQLFSRRDASCIKKNCVLTKLLKLLLVAFARDNAFLGSRGLRDGLLEGDEPAIALQQVLGLEGVLAAMQLEMQGNGAILAKFSRIGL